MQDRRARCNLFRVKLFERGGEVMFFLLLNASFIIIDLKFYHFSQLLSPIRFVQYRVRSGGAGIGYRRGGEGFFFFISYYKPSHKMMFTSPCVCVCVLPIGYFRTPPFWGNSGKNGMFVCFFVPLIGIRQKKKQRFPIFHSTTLPTPFWLLLVIARIGHGGPSPFSVFFPALLS